MKIIECGFIFLYDNLTKPYKDTKPCSPTAQSRQSRNTMQKGGADLFRTQGAKAHFPQKKAPPSPHGPAMIIEKDMS